MRVSGSVFGILILVSDPLPEGDVYLIRQVLQHLSNAEILRFLERMLGKHVYVSEGHPVRGWELRTQTRPQVHRYASTGAQGSAAELNWTSRLSTKLRANYFVLSVLIRKLL